MIDREGPPRKRNTLVIANLFVFALLVGSGLVHGRLTDRWGTSDALAGAVARINQIPLTIGDWRGRDVEMDRKQIERAGIRGHLSRSYRNSRDGREISILLVCGRPGPIAVHTPDICYRGAGYEAESEPVIEVLPMVGGRSARFFKARFRKPGAVVPEILDILWAWNANGPWEVPPNPRIAFAAHQSLYKVYLIAKRDGFASASPGGIADDLEPAGAILEAIDQALLPEVVSAREPSPTAAVPHPRGTEGGRLPGSKGG